MYCLFLGTFLAAKIISVKKYDSLVFFFDKSCRIFGFWHMAEVYIFCVRYSCGVRPTSRLKSRQK